MSEYAVFCGLDVGKQDHVHATALNPAGERLFDAGLPQDETGLRDLRTHLGAFGAVLVIVDQPKSIGALPVAVARDVGVYAAYHRSASRPG